MIEYFRVAGGLFEQLNGLLNNHFPLLNGHKLHFRCDDVFDALAREKFP